MMGRLAYASIPGTSAKWMYRSARTAGIARLFGHLRKNIFDISPTSVLLRQRGAPSKMLRVSAIAHRVCISGRNGRVSMLYLWSLFPRATPHGFPRRSQYRYEKVYPSTLSKSFGALAQTPPFVGIWGHIFGGALGVCATQEGEPRVNFRTQERRPRPPRYGNIPPAGSLG